MHSIDIFPWNDNFDCGLPEIDEQHRRLVVLINQLARQQALQADPMSQRAVLDELAAYAALHFATEEAVWADAFPGDAEVSEHAAVHDSFKQTVARLVAQPSPAAGGAMEQLLTFLTRWLASHILGHDRAMARRVLAQHAMTAEPRTDKASPLHSDSTQALIEMILAVYDNLSANSLHLMRELGARRETERTLSEAHAAQQDSLSRVQLILDASQDAIVATDDAGAVQEWNLGAQRLFGLTALQARGRDVASLLLLPDGLSHPAPGFLRQLAQSGEGCGAGGGLELVGQHCNGSCFPLELSVAALHQHGQRLYCAFIRDLSDQKAAQERIAQLAYYDSLTRLPNRRLLLDRLQQALTASTRNLHQGAVLLVDLDSFKTVNETLGHDSGDQLLQQVAQRLRSAVREGDTVARSVGDEFVLILEGLDAEPHAAASHAKSVGEKARAILAVPYLLGSLSLHSTASIGITLFGGEAQDSAEELLKRSELAMHQAKAAGRNCVQFYESHMQAVVTARAALEAGLRDALESQQLRLYYQLQVNADGAPVGVEALVRWHDPQRGVVPPAAFIALAEETGLIVPLGRWVLEVACQQLAQWAADPARAHLTIAVNVSARQFHQTDFLQQVLDTLERSGAPAQRLKLELTESLLVTRVGDVIGKMHALKRHGVGFSLDDFGTGYSSLSYLKRLPLDQLKIDQGFVRDILVDANDAAIARMVLALADSLGLSVIAEGVETDAQRDLLARMGCHAYQGYLFGRPLPLAELEDLLPVSA